MEEPVDTLGGVMREVAATQRAALAQRNLLAQVRRRPPLRRSALGRMTARLPRLRVALPALAVVGAVALWFGRTTVRDRWDALNQSPLTFSVGDAAFTGKAGDRLAATADAALTLHFSDGSRVTLQRGARVQVAELDRRGAQLRLESGRADVAVHHRRDTRWQLRAGAFAVTVTGTKFSMDWEDAREALTVVMTEGAVEIRGPGVGNQSPVVVSAGQRFSGSAREARWSLGAEAAQEQEREQEPMPAPTEAPAAVPTDRAPRAMSPTSGGSPRVSAVPSNWQALARAGRYPEAVKVVERAGFERVCQRLSAEDLLQLGDAARLARNPERAETAYRAARKRFPASDRPAFALGLVAFEQRHDFKAAAHWFELYARTYPEGPLAREAVGREMESWQRAGDAARARRAARDYLDQAPTGPYAPLARQLSAR